MAEIYLRPLRMEDAQISWKWRNDPRVWKYTCSRPTCEVTLAMEEAWMRKVLSESNSRRFAICLREGDKYVGNGYVVNIDWERKCGEFAIFLGDVSVWGRGIGTQANLELQKAAGACGLREVTARIHVSNPGSLKTVLKAGFSELSRDGEWILTGKRLDVS